MVKRNLSDITALWQYNRVMLVTTRQMQDIERVAFAAGVCAEELMEEAGKKCAASILKFFPHASKAILYCGKGNNAGDALVLGRELLRAGLSVDVEFVCDSSEMSTLAQKKRGEFESFDRSLVASKQHSPDAPTILVDGLLGIGAKGPLRDNIATLAGKLNEKRVSDRGYCFAIDIPTGLDADSGEVLDGAVVADCTLSIAFSKVGFAADSVQNTLGRLEEIVLPDLTSFLPEVVDCEDSKTAKHSSITLLFPRNLKSRPPKRRHFDCHKSEAGRVLLISGSVGFSGAARLVAHGASRSGAGLVSLCVPESIYDVVASAVSAEIMVHPFCKIEDCLNLPHNVVAVGPGLGRAYDEGLVDLAFHHPNPVILDADALNALAFSERNLGDLPAQRLLTPHPGEFARLADFQGNRIEQASAAASKWGVSLILKGARSIVASELAGRVLLELNTTGHAGMASGGMGDVLTGLCASLVAQGCSLHDAATVGSWVLGRAAELAWQQNHIAPESVTAKDVSMFLGHALAELMHS